MKNFILKFVLFFLLLIILFLILIFLFNPILTADSLIFPYAIHAFDIVKVYPNTWILIKKFYFISFSISYFILFFKFSKSIKFPKKNIQKIQASESSLSIIVGLSDKEPIYISESGLYQNILITGTIGTGKTSYLYY